jgi:hypothetical protein
MYERCIKRKREGVRENVTLSSDEMTFNNGMTLYGVGNLFASHSSS